MNIRQMVKDCEPLAKLGGWLYLLLGLLVSAVVWVTTIQLSVAESSSSINDLRRDIKPLDAIRQDVRWIKKRLGGPDN